MKKRIVCGTICLAVFLALFIFTLVGLNSLIDSVVLDGVILAPETYDLWGANPGSSNALTVRNFTFYNFTNPRGYLYRGEIPKFNQMTNFVYQQRSNFTNISYSEDKSILYYNYWLYFTVLEGSRDVNETVNVINLAPLGFWNQLQTVDTSALAIQGFGGLFVQMNNTIKVQAIGQGIKGQYLNSLQNWLAYCKNLAFTQSYCMLLWCDPFYGLSDANNFEPWIDWLYYGDQNAGIALIEYFGLEQSQITGLSNLFVEWSQTLNNILGNWFCEGQSCANYELTLLQLGKGGLTGNPPTGDPVDSICQSGNVTCSGYPELYAFYQHVFLPNNTQVAYQNLSFSDQTVRQLFTPYRGTLLNVGNLSQLYKVGQALQADPKNRFLIAKMKAITHGQTEQHSWVIWKYAKYFVEEFVLKMSQKGERKFAGLAGVFTQALYQSITQFSEWFMRQFLSLIVAQLIPNCQLYLAKIDTLDKETVKKICFNVNRDNYLSYYDLIHPCLNSIVAKDFKKKYSLKGISMEELCDPSKDSLLTAAKLAHHAIYKHYKCSANPSLQRCTPFQIGAKQFLKSQITLNPLPTQIRQYSPSLTGKKWNKDLQQFQYRNYLNEVYDNPWIDKQTFDDYVRVADILSFDKFYSVPGVQDLLIQNNATKFEEKYYWNNATLLLGYMRFLTIQVGFGGMVQKRTAQQILEGYQDQFLKQLKQMDPMLGGDPSIQTIVMANDPNSTLQQAVLSPQSMYSGYSDPLLSRNYITNKNKSFVTYNKTYYTGYEIVSEQTNPFISQLELFGTDAFQNKPLSTPQDNQYIYIDTLYRIAEMNFSKEEQRFGFQIYRYGLSNNTLASRKDYKPNQMFYQQYKGLMNLSFLGLPLFASKSHLLDAQTFWLDRMEMYDQKGQNKQLPNEFDQSYLILQPKSGVTFSALLYIQTSFFLQPDILFPLQPAMLPFVTLYRSANLTESTVNDILGDLKIALAAPRYLIIFCVVGIVLTVVSIVCCIMRSKKEKQAIPSLLQSTDDVFDGEPATKVEKTQENQEIAIEKNTQTEIKLVREIEKQEKPIRVQLNQTLQPEETMRVQLNQSLQPKEQMRVQLNQTLQPEEPMRVQLKQSLQPEEPMRVQLNQSLQPEEPVRVQLNQSLQPERQNKSPQQAVSAVQQ